MHESQMHEDNCFLTLTYDEKHLPYDFSVDVTEFQRFMKRYREYLRARNLGRIKFYHCGEYGEVLGRPHYHAIIFGHDFADKKPWFMNGEHQYYDSEDLSRLWGKGLVCIGDVTFESAQYCAKYCMKKITGDVADDYYGFIHPVTKEPLWRSPEYSTMSNGIGLKWFEKFWTDVFNGGQSDDVIIDHRGRQGKPPRYYLELLRKMDERMAQRVKGKRAVAGRANVDDNTPDRLKVKEKVALARQALYGNRRYESA